MDGDERAAAARASKGRGFAESSAGIRVFAAGLVFLAGMVHGVKHPVESGKLERNSGIGVKSRVTKSSDSAWKAGHLAAGPWLLAAAWTGYFAGVVTVALGLVQALSGTDFPVPLMMPCSGMAAMIVLLVIATRKANQAGKSAREEETE